MIYGFQKRFIPRILDGTKTGTIRAPRAGKTGHARPGQGLQLKHGSRFRPVIFADTICSASLYITLVVGLGGRPPHVAIRKSHGGPLTDLIEGWYGLNRFAVRDGFDDWEDLCQFWWDTHRVTEFTGCWIQWAPTTVVTRS